MNGWIIYLLFAIATAVGIIIGMMAGNAKGRKKCRNPKLLKYRVWSSWDMFWAPILFGCIWPLTLITVFGFSAASFFRWCDKKRGIT